MTTDFLVHKLFDLRKISRPNVQFKKEQDSKNWVQDRS